MGWHLYGTGRLLFPWSYNVDLDPSTLYLTCHQRTMGPPASREIRTSDLGRNNVGLHYTSKSRRITGGSKQGPSRYRWGLESTPQSQLTRLFAGGNTPGTTRTKDMVTLQTTLGVLLQLIYPVRSSR